MNLDLGYAGPGTDHSDTGVPSAQFSWARMPVDTSFIRNRSLDHHHAVQPGVDVVLYHQGDGENTTTGCMRARPRPRCAAITAASRSSGRRRGHLHSFRSTGLGVHRQHAPFPGRWWPVERRPVQVTTCCTGFDLWLPSRRTRSRCRPDVDPLFDLLWASTPGHTGGSNNINYASRTPWTRRGTCT